MVDTEEAFARMMIPSTTMNTLSSHTLCRTFNALESPLSSRNISRVRVAAGRQKKGDDPVDSKLEALEKREAMLWDRQMEMSENMVRDVRVMYTRLEESYESLKEYHAKEREGWLEREDALRKENEELRNKLMYVMARMTEMSTEMVVGRSDGSWIDATAASGGIPETSVSMDDDEEEEDVGGVELQEEMAERGSRQSSLETDFRAAFDAVERGDILKDDPLSFRASDADILSSSDPDDTAAPTGPPPTMTIGDDDIYWMNQLHMALFDAGFYPGDEDIGDYIFGESTQSAVLTFQACNGLPETGSVDMKTWIELLGEDLEHKTSRDLTDDVNPLTDKSRSQVVPEKSDKKDPKSKPFAELFSAQVTEVSSPDNKIVQKETYVHDEKYFSDGHVEVTDEHTMSTSNGRVTWPVLLEGEGGKEVHALHVLLERAGYWPGEDDVQWWQFGDSTVTAIKTFQACNGIAESGTCDEVVWKALMGPGAVPDMIDSIKSGKSDDEDLALDGTDNRVWLIGEQRWEDRSKLS